MVLHQSDFPQIQHGRFFETLLYPVAIIPDLFRTPYELSAACFFRFAAGRRPYAIAGLWSRWFDNGSPRFSFATFTVESNDFMLPIHPQAMPVILDSKDAQKEWLLNGTRDLLVPYTGQMIAGEMPDTLERLYPEENPPAKQKAQAEPAAKKDEEIEQGSLFG